MILIFFDLHDIVDACVDNCRHLYPSYNFKKELEKNILINGNEERLEQVLINLVNNSVKYSPEIKEINIRCEKDGDYAIVSVTDFGMGMPPEEQAKVFDRFYSVEGKMRRMSGLGMGLYISIEIIKEHNGSMSVKSVLNEGSVFSFSLPLATMDINK